MALSRLIHLTRQILPIRRARLAMVATVVTVVVAIHRPAIRLAAAMVVEAALAVAVEAPAAVEVAGRPVAEVAAAHNRPCRRSLPVRRVRRSLIRPRFPSRYSPA